MAATDVPVSRLRGDRSSRMQQRLELAFQALLALALVIALAVLLVLIAQVVIRALPVFVTRGTDVITAPLSLRAEDAGVIQGIQGSLGIAAITALVAFPVGIATAIYLEEYAPDSRLTRFIDLNIRNLAGVPSVVYGLLGLAVFVELFGDRRGALTNLTGGASVLSAGLTLAVLVLPIVIITSAEAIRAVPASLRQGGFGLGATRWQVVRQLVLPAAAPGILTGTILSLSRAIGETAPLIVVGAISGYLGTGDQGFLEYLYGAFTALPMLVFNFSRQPSAAFQEELASVAIIVLLAFTLTANAVAILLRNRYERR